MIPTPDGRFRPTPVPARATALLKVLSRMPNAIRASLESYYRAFCDDVATAQRNVERHARTVVLDFIRWSDAGVVGSAGEATACKNDEILIAALAQLTVWHELYPDSTRYERRPPATPDATDEAAVESWLTGVEEADVKEESAVGRRNAAGTTAAAPFNFDGLNRAVLAWSRQFDAVAVASGSPTAQGAEKSADQQLAQAYERLKQKVFGLVRHLIHHEHDAEEIYQESLKGLAKQYSGGKCGKRNLVEEFITILRRRVVDFVRRRLGTAPPDRVGRNGPAPRRAVTNGPDLDGLASPHDRPVDAHLEEHDQFRVFMEHVLALKPRQGELIIGEYVDELDTQELPVKVACVLGIGVGMSVVYAERQKALAVIRDQLTRTGWSFPKLFTPRRRPR